MVRLQAPRPTANIGGGLLATVGGGDGGLEAVSHHLGVTQQHVRIGLVEHLCHLLENMVDLRYSRDLDSVLRLRDGKEGP